MGFILVTKPSSSNGAAFSRHLSVRLEMGKLRPRPVSMSGCFMSQRGAPGSRSKGCGFRYVRTVSIRGFGRSVDGLLTNRRICLPIFSFGDNGQGFRAGPGGLNRGSVLMVRKVRYLGPGLARRLYSSQGFEVCVDTLARLGVSRRGQVPSASKHLVQELIESTEAEKTSTAGAVSV